MVTAALVVEVAKRRPNELNALYDRIGRHYDATRKADPQIAQRVISLLNGSNGGKYLDLACGTGNYTIALRNLGLMIRGIDQSELMISTAKGKAPQMEWHVGDAEALPFAAGSFQGVTCILAIHHFKDVRKAFLEMHRVIDKGRLVIFTAYPDQMMGYWLNEYFPRPMQRGMQQMLPKSALFGHLEAAGFKRIVEESFEVPHDIQDLFLQSGKYKPEIYLRPEVRPGISTFANLASEEEISDGCRRLEQDIASGRINQVVADYSTPDGDYVFVVAEKE